MQNLNPIADHLRSFSVEPKPQYTSTPIPEVQKVVCRTPRIPVNKHTALLVAPLSRNDWLSKPPPELAKPPINAVMIITELKAELKIERNTHAITRYKLGESRKELRKAHLQLDASRKEIETLVARLQRIDSEIATHRKKANNLLERIRSI